MSYHINDLGDGRFELVEVRRTAVGVLTDRRIAERFADYLDSLLDDDLQQLADFIDDEPGDTESPRETVFSVGDIPVLDPEATPAAAPEAVPAVAPEAAAAPQDTAPKAGGGDETPLQEALRRLEGGEQLGVVADEVGIPMPKLRGIWANRSRGKPDAPAEAAPAVECSSCGREYRASATDEGLCARCTRELGRG